MRWALNEGKKPSKEHEIRNIEFAKELAAKHEFVTVLQKYVKIDSAYAPTEQYYYHLPECVFKERLINQITKVKEQEGC